MKICRRKGKKMRMFLPVPERAAGFSVRAANRIVSETTATISPSFPNYVEGPNRGRFKNSEKGG